MAARYWVGGTGTWNTTNTTNWSATSGGAGGASVPTSADNVIFDASSGSGTVTLGNAVSINGLQISGLSSVQLNTASYNIDSAGAISIANTTTFGTSTISCSNASFTITGISFSGAPNLTTTGPGATINISGCNGTFGTITFNGSGTQTLKAWGTSVSVNSVVVNGSSSGFGQAFVFDQYPLSSGNSATILYINSSLTLAGFSQTQRLLVYSRGGNWGQTDYYGNGATISVPATRSISNCDFRDVYISGNPLSGTSIGDCGGNSGVTFTTPVTRYVVGSGNYSSASIWSATSNGATGATVPLPQDTAILNQFSGNVTIDYSRIGNLSSVSGYVGSVSVTPALLQLYGSLSLQYGTITYPTNMDSYGYSKTISNTAFTGTLTVRAGSLTLTSNTASGAVVLYAGQITFTNGSTNTIGSFSINSGTTNPQNNYVYLGGSTIILSGSLNAWSTNNSYATVLNSSTCSITLSYIGTSDVSFLGGSRAYQKLTIGGGSATGAVIISSPDTFGEIACTRTSAFMLKFASSLTTTIGKWSIAGTAGNLVTVTATSTGAATLAYSGTGKVSTDYLSVSKITGSPALTWYVGANSTNGGSNTNIYFSAPPSGNGIFFGSNF